MASPALLHQRQRRVGAVEEAEQVDVDHPPPLLGVGALDRAQQHHAGVVDEDVEAAHLLGGVLDEGARGGLVADVDLERVGLPPSASICLRQLVEAVLAARSERHRGALGGQRGAVAAPIPDEAPVITALRPSSPFGTGRNLLQVSVRRH